MTLDSVFELIKKFADVLIVWAMFYYILKNLRKNVGSMNTDIQKNF